MSKHRETKGNPLHGSNTLIVKVPETLTLASRTAYHGGSCIDCVNYFACRKLKGRIDYSNYCHLRFGSFSLAPRNEVARRRAMKPDDLAAEATA